MKSSNYLIRFLGELNELISEIDKLNSKQRLYQKNCEIFGMDYVVRFSIKNNYFKQLRDFIIQKIDEGSKYDKKIVNLKRNITRNKPYLIIKIEQEILRIEENEKLQISKLVSRAIYQSKIESELNQISSYLRESTIIERFLGVAKYRKLMVKNHTLKKELIEKEHEKEVIVSRTPIENVNLIENTEYKSGELLCIQEDIIKYFMIDRSIIKSDKAGFWKASNLIPAGFFEKRAYYKLLNKNIEEENILLEEKIENVGLTEELSNNRLSHNLVRLNTKLGKIIKGELQKAEA